MLVGRRTILFLSVFSIAAPLFAQSQDVGGAWTKNDGKDPADDKSVVFFTLPADDADLARHPYIQLECTGDGKLVHARYFADTDLVARDADYKNYRAPAIIPRITVDKKTFKGIWDMLPGNKSAEIDDKTLHALFTGTTMQVRYTDKAYNDFIDVYSLPGLSRHEIEKACGEHKWLTITAK